MLLLVNAPDAITISSPCYSVAAIALCQALRGELASTKSTCAAQVLDAKRKCAAEVAAVKAECTRVVERTKLQMAQVSFDREDW